MKYIIVILLIVSACTDNIQENNQDFICCDDYECFLSSDDSCVMDWCEYWAPGERFEAGKNFFFYVDTCKRENRCTLEESLDIAI